MTPDPSTHLVVLSGQAGPDGMLDEHFCTVEELPKPIPESLLVELRAWFIMRQPNEWVIMLREDGGVRVGVGTRTMFTQPMTHGVN